MRLDIFVGDLSRHLLQDPILFVNEDYSIIKIQTPRVRKFLHACKIRTERNATTPSGKKTSYCINPMTLIRALLNCTNLRLHRLLKNMARPCSQQLVVFHAHSL
jgi:hypothetical protein